MNWFRQNRFLGYFFVALGVGTLGAAWFLFSAKSDADEASTRLNQTVVELNRLERLTPYPSGENLRKMKAHADDYAGVLAKLKDELKMRVPPATPMAPNEFQGRLRVAMNAVAEKARANKVKLPDKFYLGFDEFASVLPRTEAAPLLGQELTQVEWLLNTLIAARVDALTALHRTALSEERGGGATSSPTTAAPKTGPAVPGGPKLLERGVVEVTFVSTPAAARRALNLIAEASQQFFIIRLLHVRNEKDKGPPREVAPETTGATAVISSPAPSGSPGAKPTPGAALNFIVGNEHIETSAKIEIVRFTF